MSFEVHFWPKYALKDTCKVINEWTMLKLQRQFVEYSKELAEDILGFNQWYNRGRTDSERNRKLRYHIKRCEKLLNEMENKNG